eukprot:755164-Hanusia_phi.AAC.5
MELDPGATGRISVTLVPELIRSLSPPLGLRKEHVTEPMLIKVTGVGARAEEGNPAVQIIKDLHIPVHGEHVRYYHTFAACVKRVLSEGDLGEEDEFEKEMNDEANDKSATGLDSKYNRRQEEGPIREPETETQHDNRRTATAAEDYASRCLQRAYREWKERSLQVGREERGGEAGIGGRAEMYAGSEGTEL